MYRMAVTYACAGHEVAAAKEYYKRGEQDRESARRIAVVQLPQA